MTDIYGINFVDPPRKNSGSLRDGEIQANFTSKKREEWLVLSEKHSFCYVSVPSYWPLNLYVFHMASEITVYRVC